MASKEQERIIAHPSDAHGRVLAGPGTGKSSTVLLLAKRLIDEGKAVRVITFTRAATAELAGKVKTDSMGLEPATVHGFALSVLLSNPSSSSLPKPLRIPDEWESEELIRSDLAARLRRDGFDKATVRDVRKLETEMASEWESLDPKEKLLADVAPELRNRYLGLWAEHRKVFGYSLFAEMPLYAKNLIEDKGDVKTGNLNVLIVDEFQDLNRCEIALVEALAKRGVAILAVGDDDQSIYSFRMAHPVGIQEFPSKLAGKDYTLTTSFRCGREILDVAKALIESTPGRPPRVALKESPANPTGVFEYLRFPTETDERVGIAKLVSHLVKTEKIHESEIAVLLRADYNGNWSEPIRAALVAQGLKATDVEAALNPLGTRAARRLLAIARLAESGADDLAWWTLLYATPGISKDFMGVVADECMKRGERFGVRVRKLETDPPAGVKSASLKRAIKVVADTIALIGLLDSKGAKPSPNGWADWLQTAAGLLGIPIADDFLPLLLAVGKATPQEAGLNHFLNQVEPVTKDLAVRTQGVAIMTMGRSKGLTFRASLVVGVEEGVIPFPKARDENEERRLLYVAMTRAREYLYLTMATRRTDATARTGDTMLYDRRRCPFFEVLGIGPTDGYRYLGKMGIN